MRRLDVCMHEAGHAVAAVVLNLGLCYARVWQKMAVRQLDSGPAMASGHVRVRTASQSQWRRSTWRRRTALMLLAGHLARDEYRQISARDDIGSHTDLSAAIYMLETPGHRARRLVAAQLVSLLRQPRRETRALLRAHWPAVRAVARMLQRRGHLTGRQVRAIVRRTSATPGC